MLNEIYHHLLFILEDHDKQLNQDEIVKILDENMASQRYEASNWYYMTFGNIHYVQYANFRQRNEG
jgi:hypothetical protein